MIHELPYLASSTELLVGQPQRAFRVKPTSLIGEILAGKNLDVGGVLFLPRRMQGLLRMGESTDVPNIVLVHGMVVIYVTYAVEELVLLPAEFIPNKYIDQFVITRDTSELEPFTPKEASVPVFHIPVFNNYFIAPGWEFEHIKSGRTYEVLALSNHGREIDRHSKYNFGVVYREVGGTDVWSLDVASFIGGFRKTEGKKHSARLELVSSARPKCSPLAGNLYFNWKAQGIGFGQLNISDLDGGFNIQNEGMSRRFLKSVLCSVVDDANLDD